VRFFVRKISPTPSRFSFHPWNRAIPGVIKKANNIITRIPFWTEREFRLFERFAHVVVKIVVKTKVNFSEIPGEPKKGSKGKFHSNCYDR